MNFIQKLKNHSNNIDKGISKQKIRDFELKLNIKLPQDFREYLLNYNYAEIYDDPLYGIHLKDSVLKNLDLYHNNSNTEHFKYGFLEIFSNDIDGTIYLRADNGMIYSDFSVPLSKSFSAFVELLLNEEK